MTAWFVAAIPLLIMFFALAMERVEARLRQVAVAEKDVEEFLEQARPDEVRELARLGIWGALEQFKLRRRTRRPPVHPMRYPVGHQGGYRRGAAPLRSHEPDPMAATVPIPKVRIPPRRRAS